MDFQHIIVRKRLVPSTLHAGADRLDILGQRCGSNRMTRSASARTPGPAFRLFILNCCFAHWVSSRSAPANNNLSISLPALPLMQRLAKLPSFSKSRSRIPYSRWVTLAICDPSEILLHTHLGKFADTGFCQGPCGKGIYRFGCGCQHLFSSSCTRWNRHIKKIRPGLFKRLDPRDSFIKIIDTVHHAIGPCTKYEGPGQST